MKINLKKEMLLYTDLVYFIYDKNTCVHVDVNDTFSQ